MVIIRAFEALQEMKVVAITREHVLQALSTVTVDSAGTSLEAEGQPPVSTDAGPPTAEPPPPVSEEPDALSYHNRLQQSQR